VLRRQVPEVLHLEAAGDDLFVDVRADDLHDRLSPRAVANS
jgi:hypothetical protein